MYYKDDYNYNRLHFGYFYLRKYLKYLTPNEQAYIISKHGRDMRYESIMNKFNLNLFQLNIIKHSAELKMTLLITKKLLPWQEKEVEKIKSVVYPELTEEEYDDYIWDENEDLTEAYFSGAYSNEVKQATETKPDVKVESKEFKQTTETKPNVEVGSKEVEPAKEKTVSKKRTSRKGVISVSEDDKLKIIQNLKYFSPVKQLCLITGYELFGESYLSLADIAVKFDLTPGRISQIKKSVIEDVNKYIFGDDVNDVSKLKTYEPFTRESYLSFFNLQQEKKAELEQSSVENVSQTKVESSEEEIRKDILDIMKYFSKAEQICLVYGYGLFGVKRGDKKQLKKHFRDDYDFNSIFKKVVFKKRILTKPVDKMTAGEFAAYQQITSTTHDVLDKEYFAKKSEKNSNKKENEQQKKSLIKADILKRDLNKLRYLMPKMQYVLLANLGVYGKKLTLKEIATNLDYTPGQVGRYKAYADMCMSLLDKDKELFTEEEKDTYNEIITNTYPIMTEEEFLNFPNTFVKNKKKKEENITEEKETRTRYGGRLVAPDYLKLDYLQYFPVKEQVIMYLIFGLEDKQKFAMAKVAEAVNVQTNTIRRYIDEILGKMKILSSNYDELNYADRRIYDSLINKNYYKITYENLFDYIPNKNSEIYFYKPKTID